MGSKDGIRDCTAAISRLVDERSAQSIPWILQHLLHRMSLKVARTGEIRHARKSRLSAADPK
jgi:hypothetical protein